MEDEDFGSTEYISDTTDLVYSPDDNGYYFSLYDGGNGKVSQIFGDRAEALCARSNNKIKWED